MDQIQIDKIKDLIEYERNRKSPPSTFPKLPDLPGKRYTDNEFFELEKEIKPLSLEKRLSMVQEEIPVMAGQFWKSKVFVRTLII